jgi:hypothetical protein
MSAQGDALQQACSLVGLFQYHFARVEQKIDQAVIKLLDLDEKAASIVTGSVDFAKKLNLVRTSAYLQAGNDKDKKLADDTCVDVFNINMDRQVVIHSSFEPAPAGGVQFRRTVAKNGRVRIDDQVWDDEKFSQRCSEMRRLEADLDKLIRLIKPVEVPNFGWYMPLSDMTHRNTSLPLRVAAMNALVGVPWFPGKDDTSPPR